MNNNTVASISLTDQKKSAIIHALYELIDQKNNDVIGLAKRLQCTIDHMIPSFELSKEEIDDIIGALELALKKTRDFGAKRYGPLSPINELERLTDDFRELLKRF